MLCGLRHRNDDRLTMDEEDDRNKRNRKRATLQYVYSFCTSIAPTTLSFAAPEEITTVSIVCDDTIYSQI